jgi:hypothetical protein
MTYAGKEGAGGGGIILHLTSSSPPRRIHFTCHVVCRWGVESQIATEVVK